jgi:hypothetical protein
MLYKLVDHCFNEKSYFTYQLMPYLSALLCTYKVYVQKYKYTGTPEMPNFMIISDANILGSHKMPNNILFPDAEIQ